MPRQKSGQKRLGIIGAVARSGWFDLKGFVLAAHAQEIATLIARIEKPLMLPEISGMRRPPMPGQIAGRGDQQQGDAAKPKRTQ